MVEILNGNFDTALKEHIKKADELEEMKKLCKEKVYTYRKVLEIEAAGFDVIGGLLKEFIYALQPKTKKSEKIQKIISEHYVAKQLDTPDQRYEAILQVVQFVSGMTDTYAIDTYRSITGIHLPNY